MLSRMTTASLSNPLRMQIVVRRDLLEVRSILCSLVLSNALTALVKKLDWPVGPLMAQASHAATAVLHKFKDEDDVKEYLDDLDNMRKVRAIISTFHPSEFECSRCVHVMG